MRGKLLVALLLVLAPALAAMAAQPEPLLSKGKPVSWWFVFKLNNAVFPGCTGDAKRSCPFGGQVQTYKVGQQFVYASSAKETLQVGKDCAGDSDDDPVGATFDEIYNGDYHFVVWNDQFYDHPVIQGCTKECGGPWGHSKGILAWDDNGEGVVMQVSTPSWPGAGSHKHPRAEDGNSLGCVEDDDVMVSQHFFALKLSKADVVTVLKGLANASIVTDVNNPQLVDNGGPSDITSLVSGLGKKSTSEDVQLTKLSTGVTLISKPSKEAVPPWQMVSHELGNVSFRAATWWAHPAIPSTTKDTAIACWPSDWSKPGAVDIATTGSWDGKKFSLEGGGGPDHNHAKLGVSTSGDKNYVVFGDLNQQGVLSGTNCKSSQNGRGGLFFVISNAALHKSVSDLIAGESAPE